MNEKYIEIIKKNYKYALILVFGIILIFFSSFDFGKTDNNIEKNLKNTLEMAEGVGEVDVMVTYNDKKAVQGVIIVAEGAENAEIKKMLRDSAIAALNLPDYKVLVLTKKK